jgi:hypothetical protein
MKFNNNTILFLLLGMIGMTGLICVTILVYKHGANIELNTLVQLVILAQVPITIVAALSARIKIKNNKYNIIDEEQENKNAIDNIKKINKKLSNEKK